MTMTKYAALILAGGLLLATAACMQQNQPLTAEQQLYYKHLQEYQALGDARRRDRPCHMNNCM
jgi:hypothetical protein